MGRKPQDRTTIDRQSPSPSKQHSRRDSARCPRHASWSLSPEPRSCPLPDPWSSAEKLPQDHPGSEPARQASAHQESIQQNARRFRPIKHIGQQFSIQENVGPVVCGPKEEGRLNRLGHSEALPQPNLIVLLWVPRPPDPKGLMTWLILGRNRPRVGPLGKPTLGRPRSHKNRGQQDSSH